MQLYLFLGVMIVALLVMCCQSRMEPDASDLVGTTYVNDLFRKN